MQGYTLNAELVSNKKFDESSLAEIKNSMESKEDFIAFYSIFAESMQISFNDFIEIYVEDYILENDLQNDLGRMLKDLDLTIPGGLCNDSKIEWVSDFSNITVVWYKDNGSWIETITDTESDFLDDWMNQDSYDRDDLYEGYSDNSDDDNW